MNETREKLLRAAEKLFATQGIGATTIRDVNALADQRNTSAIRYHFAGMDGLLASLVELRMGELDEARSRALNELERISDGAVISVEDYVAVLVLPLVDRVHADEQWASWVRILAQLLSVHGREHRQLWEGRHDRTTREVFERLRTLVPNHPEPVWVRRVEDMMLLCVGSLSERAFRLYETDAGAALSLSDFSDNLVVVCSAVLRASKGR